MLPTAKRFRGMIGAVVEFVEDSKPKLISGSRHHDRFACQESGPHQENFVMI